MSVQFKNSETVNIDGKEVIYLRESIAILSHLQGVLARVGAENFFSSPHDDIKKARESMAGLFYLLALQSETNNGLYLMQPQNDPPDFVLMTLGETIEETKLNKVELVEVPSRCESFDEAIKIVQKKINKGYAESYDLLIFVNNPKCKEWLPLFNAQLGDYHPFASVWALNLLEQNGDYWPVVNRLRPLPVRHIENKLGDIILPNKVSPFMEVKTQDGKSFMAFKPELIKEFTKKYRKSRLNKNA